MAKMIDDYLVLSVTDMKRMGFFAPGTRRTDIVSWRIGGRVVATVRFTTDTRQQPKAVLEYVSRGEPVAMEIGLSWKRSNLDASGKSGYYLFVCPVTGKDCRKLYLYDGQFVSRQAFRPLYEQQRRSKKSRDALSYLATALKVEELSEQPRHRETHGGKPTRYARRVEGLLRSLKKKERSFRFDFLQ